MSRRFNTETLRSQVLSVGEIPTDKTMSPWEKNFQIERRELLRRNFMVYFFLQIFSFAGISRQMKIFSPCPLCLRGETVHG